MLVGTADIAVAASLEGVETSVLPTAFLTLLLFFPGTHSTACPARRRMATKKKIMLSIKETFSSPFYSMTYLSHERLFLSPDVDVLTKTYVNKIDRPLIPFTRCSWPDLYPFIQFRSKIIQLPTFSPLSGTDGMFSSM